MKKTMSAIVITMILGSGSLFFIQTKTFAVTTAYKYKNCWFQATDYCGGSGRDCAITTTCRAAIDR